MDRSVILADQHRKVLALQSLTRCFNSCQVRYLTLEEMIKQVNAFEASRVANDQMGGKSAPLQMSRSTDNVQYLAISCKFCGRSLGQQPCPALDKTCAKCGKRGHFAVACYSSAPYASTNRPMNSNKPYKQFSLKRPHEQIVSSGSGPSTKRKSAPFARKIHSKQIELVEMVSSGNESDELIWATVSGVLIEMQIDSGVQSYIIDGRTWESMNRNGVNVVGEVRGSDRKFKAYAQAGCLEVIAMFDAVIVISDGQEQLKTLSRFYVVKNGPQPLLGKRTAKQLGVLVVGLPSQRNLIHHVDACRSFPCIKGIKIHIPIDRSVLLSVSVAYLYLCWEKVDEKLNELLSKDIIERIFEPSRWVSPMVIVVKDSGDVRQCIDMRQLNKAILRETHPLPTIEEIRWRINGAKFFSRLDIKDAFHQLQLDDESKHLTTFITHRGLFRYKRLVFGISCAPEMFQKKLEQILADCENTVNFIDDIVVTGGLESEHDLALEKVLKKLSEYGILLNQSKCVFKLTEIEFIGQRFNQNGMIPSESKIEVIQSFRSPKIGEEVRSFLGLVNYVGSFIPDLATISFPLRELTKNNVTFVWEEDHKRAFNELIRLVGNIKTLAHFNPRFKTRVIADVSPVGLGAVLLQFHEDHPKVIAYASKSLTSTECRYAQTEKEALALVWAVERCRARN